MEAQRREEAKAPEGLLALDAQRARGWQRFAAIRKVIAVRAVVVLRIPSQFQLMTSVKRYPIWMVCGVLL